jgi:hypothetical protein
MPLSYLFSPPSAPSSLRRQLIGRLSSRHSSSILPEVRRITLSSQLSETSAIAIAIIRFLNIPRVNISFAMRAASSDAKLVALVNTKLLENKCPAWKRALRHDIHPL